MDKFFENLTWTVIGALLASGLTLIGAGSAILSTTSSKENE